MILSIDIVVNIQISYKNGVVMLFDTKRPRKKIHFQIKRTIALLQIRLSCKDTLNQKCN